MKLTVSLHFLESKENKQWRETIHTQPQILNRVNPLLVQTGTTIDQLLWSHSHPDWLQTKYFGFNAGPKDRYYCLRSRYVSLGSFLASSNFYLGSELLLMTGINAKRTSPTYCTTHLPPLQWDVRLFVLGSRQERLKRWKRDLKTYGAQVRTPLYLYMSTVTLIHLNSPQSRQW